MTFTMELTLVRSERVLERVLSLIGRRGYEVVSVRTELSPDATRHDMFCRIEADRSPQVLENHVAKLRDVLDVVIRSGK